MRILAHQNVPEASVSALIEDGHGVTYSRDVPELGIGANDRALVEYAEHEGMAVLSADVKDFSSVDAAVAVLVPPQDLTGGAVRRAVNRMESMDFDPSDVEPIWLSALCESLGWVASMRVRCPHEMPNVEPVLGEVRRPP